MVKKRELILHIRSSLSITFWGPIGYQFSLLLLSYIYHAKTFFDLLPDELITNILDIMTVTITQKMHTAS